jgi:signal transduction histidine kinase/ligand-binding sensor domain-containing protein/DNA-binding response OmpR family regulator
LKKTFSLLLLFSFFVTNALAQNFYFSNYQVEDGLSNNTVTSSIQDHRGFLWFGSKDGLNRFDGYNFKTFRHEEENENSLGSSFIRTLHEFKNNIWVGTDNGLYKYNEELEDFDLVKITADKPILDIDNDDQGNIWFIASGVIFKLFNEKGNYKDFESYDITYAEWIMKDVNGRIWMASQSNLYWYSEKEDRFKIKDLPAILANASPFIITQIYSLNESVILLGTKYYGAFKFNLLDNTLTSVLPESENPLFVRDFILKKSNELWIATESGLFIYDITKNTFINLKKSYNNKYALTDNALYSFTKDHEGGIWIGSYFGGINYFSKSYTPFKKYFPMVGENSISGNAVREIHKDQYGKLWIGTEDAGLNRLDPVSGEFEHISKENLSYYNIHGILPLQDELWVGTFEHGLDILDIKTGKRLRHYKSDGTPGSLRSDFILDIFYSSREKLYILTSKGIHEYNPTQDNFEIVKAFPENHHYSYFEEDEFGILWAGTYWDGLYYYDPETEKTGVYKHESGNPKSLSSNVISSIYHDSRNHLWIATQNGLNLFNKKSNNFTRINSKNGLPSNVINSILEDDYHNIWISTSGGLVNLDPDTLEKNETYTVANGLLSDQFNDGSAYKAQDGTMYFGSVDGMISFNPNTFMKNYYEAPTLFIEMQINNIPVKVGEKGSPLIKSINFLDKIELSHLQSSFSLYFATLNYTAPEMTNYWYQMKGISDKWIPLGKEHRVFFIELPSGKYNLKVKSKNSQGLWNKETPELSIVVLPPFWLSNWAYLLYWFIIITILFFLTRYYHIYNKNKNQLRINAFEIQKEKEVYQAKIEFFTNVAHEIRTPLTLIKAPLDNILKKINTSLQIKEDVEIMDKNTSRLLDLVNQLLDFRKTEFHSLKLTFVEVNINRLLKNLYQRFKPAIQEKEIDFEMDIPDVKILAFVDEEAVRKILSNLFNNAIKYCKNRVRINLTADNESFELKIKNDGKLIPTSLSNKIFEPFFRINENETNNSGTGIGLSLAYSLAVLHKGNLVLQNENGKANIFVLKLPLHQEREFQLYDTGKNQQKLENSMISEKNDLPNEKSKIVLVEDNEDLLNFLFKELRMDYCVYKALDGHTGLEIIRKENIQLVISDVSMPGMNGYELCTIIKTQLESSHIPVILLTAKNAIEAKIEGLESGADTYMTKPFSTDHLKAQMNTLIQNRRHVMNYFTSSPLAHIKTIAHTKTDSDFIKCLEDVIYKNLSNSDFDVEILADIMSMSRSTLYRKIKDLSNLTPNELINITRLKKAAELLNTGKFKIFEVADKVGYKSHNSLGRNFQKQFKMTPTEYISGTKF